jgi:phage protein U
MKRVVKVNTAGTDESALKGVVYPNPAQENIGLEVSATEVVAVGADGIQRYLSPLDSEGRRWSVLDLPNGLYTIQAIADQKAVLRTRLAVVH